MHSSTTVQPNGGAIVTNALIERTQSQWLFTQSELLKSPSVLEGMPPAQESMNRQKGVGFITQVGIMLKLPQLTLATASVFFHRFYMRHPMQISKDKGIHHYQVAATALFLATKVEENCRKMRELIVACCRVAQKQPNLVVDDQSKEYWKWRDTILYNEDVLLEALCFDLQLEQPYRILLDFLYYYGVQENKNLRNTSWAFLNDSHITTLCLLFPPRTIAGSALYVGVKLANVALPDDDQEGRAWWQHLDLDIFDIQKACNIMAEVYENHTLPRQGPKEAYLKEDDIMSFDRTRRTRSPSMDKSPAYSQRSASQGMKREREDSWGHEQQTSNAEAGAPSQDSFAGGQGPSPKRPRTDSQSNGDNNRSTRIPSIGGSRVPQSMGSAKDSAHAGDVVERHPSDANTEDKPPYESKLSYHEKPANWPSASKTNGTSPSTTNGTAVYDKDPPNQQSNAEPGYIRANANNDHAEDVDYGSEEGEV